MTNTSGFRFVPEYIYMVWGPRCPGLRTFECLEHAQEFLSEYGLTGDVLFQVPTRERLALAEATNMKERTPL